MPAIGEVRQQGAPAAPTGVWPDPSKLHLPGMVPPPPPMDFVSYINQSNVPGGNTEIMQSFTPEQRRQLSDMFVMFATHVVPISNITMPPASPQEVPRPSVPGPIHQSTCQSTRPQ